MLRKEGVGGLEEGSRVVCVKNKGVRYHIVSRRNGVYTNLPLLVHVLQNLVTLVGVVQYSSTTLLGPRK